MTAGSLIVIAVLGAGALVIAAMVASTLWPVALDVYRVLGLV